jgi:hypothetical protein
VTVSEEQPWCKDFQLHRLRVGHRVEGSRDDLVVNSVCPRMLGREIACLREDERRKIPQRYVEVLDYNHKAASQKDDLQMAYETR